MVSMEKADGTNIDSPAPGDVAAALAGPRDDDWYLTLDRDDADLMDFTADGDGFRVRCEVGETPAIESTSVVDESAARDLALSFIEGTDAWRHQVAWSEPAKRAPKSHDTPEKTRIMMIFVGVFMGGLAIASFLGLGPWVGVWFALGFPGLIAAAMAAKQAEAKGAAKWTKASGRVLRSRLKGVKSQGKESQAADIEYEFTIGFNRFRGNRPNFAEIVDGDEAKALVKRYPEGASVPVYYDPADPSKSVIDRELPKFFAVAWAVIAGLAVAIAAGGAWLILH
jgi:hypothetical protein